MNKYTHLFEPIRIGRLMLKNRIFSAPTGLMSYTPDGHLNTEDIAYYEMKAKGGCAVVTLGESIVHCETGRSHDRQIAMDDPNVLPSLSRVVKAINRHGAVANIELSHGGKYSGLQSIGGENIAGRKSYGPSAAITPNGEEIFEMPQEIIYTIIDSFGSAAALAKRAGFGMVMVHAGHGWLFNQFLSPLENKRRDEFGGSLENRARFLMLALDKVRQSVGPHFPIQIRMNGKDFTDGGLEIDDYREIARMVENKVDLFNISCGSHDGEGLFVRTHPSIFLEHGCNVFLAEAIKKTVSKPVSCVGALGNPRQCEEIIASGKADIVELARALIADPFLPQKAFTGREAEITPCLRCYSCINDLITSGTVSCAVNPVTGHELYHNTSCNQPPLTVKKILIVGGGPAGMQAAVTAAERGHQVTLYEKDDTLGGALRYAEHVSFKEDLHAFCRYLVNRVHAQGVRVILNREVTQQLLKEEQPDVLILAVGAEPIVPNIPGIDLEHVMFASEADRQPDILGNSVVVIGGGLVGCETALHLAKKGKKVTVLEMLDRIAPDANDFYLQALQQELDANIKVLAGMKGKHITKEGIYCEDKTGKDIFLPADSVVYAVGMQPRHDVVDAFLDPACEQYVIGDCVRPGQVNQAIFHAYYLAQRL